MSFAMTRTHPQRRPTLAKPTYRTCSANDMMQIYACSYMCCHILQIIYVIRQVIDMMQIYACSYMCCHILQIIYVIWYLSDFRPKYVARSLLSTRIATRNGFKSVSSSPSRAMNPCLDTFSNSSIMAPMHSCITCMCLG